MTATDIEQENVAVFRPADPRRSTVHAALTAAAVWGIWLLMSAGSVWLVVTYGRDIPVAEDWNLVRPLTGNEPDLLAWAWLQVNEHRVAVTKLTYLGVLKLGGGDFRAGMFFNLAVLAAVSAALILTARRVRGGAYRLSDAFFPIALLHLGHWNNIAWGWQLQFTVSVCLALVLFIAVVTSATVKAPHAAAVLGCFVLLPFSGANGLMTVAAMAPWAIVAGYRQLRDAPRTRSWTPGVLLVAAASAAVLLITMYFWGFTQQGSHVPNPGPAQTLETTLRLAAYAWGPAVWHAWTLGSTAALLVIGITAAVLTIAWWQRGGAESRLFGVASFFCACVGVVAALGWGRAGWVPQFGYPARYVLLVTPTLIVAYLVWELFGPRRLSWTLPLALFLTMAALIPANTRGGYEGFGNWYVSHSAAVERDVAAGATAEDIADRHQGFLLHWDKDGLLDGLRTLRDARLTVFRALRPSQASRHAVTDAERMP